MQSYIEEVTNWCSFDQIHSTLQSTIALLVAGKSSWCRSVTHRSLKSKKPTIRSWPTSCVCARSRVDGFGECCTGIRSLASLQNKEPMSICTRPYSRMCTYKTVSGVFSAEFCKPSNSCMVFKLKLCRRWFPVRFRQTWKKSVHTRVGTAKQWFDESSHPVFLSPDLMIF